MRAKGEKGARMKSESENKRRKVPLFEKIEKRIELDADMMRSGEWIEIRGRNRAEIGGVRRILSYSDTCIQLTLKQGVLSVNGRDLECVLYRNCEVAIEGHIDTVSFSE